MERGLDEALTYTAFPSSHHRLIRTTNGLEPRSEAPDPSGGRLPERAWSAETLATAVLLRVSEDWSERRYLVMTPLHALFYEPTTFAT